MPYVLSHAKSTNFKDVDWLRENYIVKGCSIPDIAKECGVSKSTITQYIHGFGLQRKSSRPLDVEVLCSHCSQPYSLPRRVRDKYLKRNPDHNFLCSKECMTEWRRKIAFGGLDKFELAKRATAVRVQSGQQDLAVKRLRKGRERYEAETPDWRRRLSKSATERMQTPEGIEASRRGGVNATIRQAKDGRETSIERKVREFLERASVPHVAQHPIRYWVTDFYLPEHNVVIECQGDYWHANPTMFPEPNATQRKNIARDAGKRAYLAKCGYNVIELWESDINDHFAMCVYRIMHAIQTSKTSLSIGIGG